ncbi:hypothetical protein RCL1_002443 [Eukaryota sp. TZLM3-RCL]
MCQYRSNAATFNDFRNYVLEKTRVTETNDWFYRLDLWRIHKMQIFSHRQKVESKLKTSLIEKYATRVANGRVLKKPVIMIGDFTKFLFYHEPKNVKSPMTTDYCMLNIISNRR